MWPNDADGNAIRAALGPLLEKAGYTIVDPGAYQDGTNDYSSQIAQFKSEGVPDLQHVPDPAGLRDVLAAGGPAGADKQIKIAQIAKTGLFPSQVDGARRDRRQPGERRATGTRRGRTRRR